MVTHASKKLDTPLFAVGAATENTVISSDLYCSYIVVNSSIVNFAAVLAVHCVADQRSVVVLAVGERVV